MSRYLLDTNHAGTLLNEHAKLWERLKDMDRGDVDLCMPVVAELWFMVFNSARVRANRNRLEALLAQFDIRPFDMRAAMEFGKLRAEVREKGRPVPTFDVLIAAIARINKLVLLTADQHFNVIDGLSVENWLT